MCACERIKLPKKKVCIGDRNHQINILSRTIKSTGVLSVDYKDEFNVISTVWAAIKTNRNNSSFNGVGISRGGTVGGFTHIFYINPLDSCEITAENWIECGDRLYKILEDPDNLDENDLTLAIYCEKKGSITLDANKA